MLPSNDPETLRLFVEQRREEVRRTAEASRSLADLLAGARRRSADVVRAPRRAMRVLPSRRPV